MQKLSSAKPNKPGRKPIYPWRDWLGCKGTILLEQGIDYTCQLASMVSILRRKAAQLGLRVSIYADPKGLVLVNHGTR